MTTLRNWICTIPFLFVSVATLLAWHPLLMVCARIDKRLMARLTSLGGGALLPPLYLVGKRIVVRGLEKLPPGGPFVVISNHQSFYDIPLLLWYLRRFSPRFVAKKQLAKGFPSVSLALRSGGSALIDRADQNQAISATEMCGVRAREEKAAVVIFPEGTRSRDGRVGRFKEGGILALVRTMPEAAAVVVAIEGSHGIGVHNFLPVPVGGEVLVDIVSVFPAGELTPERIQQVEESIRASVEGHRALASGITLDANSPA